MTCTLDRGDKSAASDFLNIWIKCVILDWTVLKVEHNSSAQETSVQGEYKVTSWSWRARSHLLKLNANELGGIRKPLDTSLSWSLLNWTEIDPEVWEISVGQKAPTNESSSRNRLALMNQEPGSLSGFTWSYNCTSRVPWMGGKLPPQSYWKWYWASWALTSVECTLKVRTSCMAPWTTRDSQLSDASSRILRSPPPKKNPGDDFIFTLYVWKQNFKCCSAAAGHTGQILTVLNSAKPERFDVNFHFWHHKYCGIHKLYTVVDFQSPLQDCEEVLDDGL